MRRPAGRCTDRHKIPAHRGTKEQSCLHSPLPAPHPLAPRLPLLPSHAPRGPRQRRRHGLRRPLRGETGTAQPAPCHRLPGGKPARRLRLRQPATHQDRTAPAIPWRRTHAALPICCPLRPAPFPGTHRTYRPPAGIPLHRGRKRSAPKRRKTIRLRQSRQPRSTAGKRTGLYGPPETNRGTTGGRRI